MIILYIICYIFKYIHYLFQIWNFVWTCLDSFVYHHVFHLWSSWCFFVVHSWLQDFKFGFMEIFFNVYFNSIKFKMLEEGGNSHGSPLVKNQCMHPYNFLGLGSIFLKLFIRIFKFVIPWLLAWKIFCWCSLKFRMHLSFYILVVLLLSTHL
jgi:hypothetical protein